MDGRKRVSIQRFRANRAGAGKNHRKGHRSPPNADPVAMHHPRPIRTLPEPECLLRDIIRTGGATFQSMGLALTRLSAVSNWLEKNPSAMEHRTGSRTP